MTHAVYKQQQLFVS